jgi:hypothetical protein
MLDCTFFMFSARRSYSSSTSCSRGLRSSLGAEADAEVDSAGSILQDFWDSMGPVILRVVWHSRAEVINSSEAGV